MDLSFKLIWWIYDEECRKHEEEQIRMNRIWVEFENQWQMDTSTASTLVQFPIELTEVLNLSSWIRNAIRTHIANGSTIEDKDVVHLSMKPNCFKVHKNEGVWKSLQGQWRWCKNHNGNIWFWGYIHIPTTTSNIWRHYTWLYLVCGGTKGHNLARLWTYIPTSGAF